MATKNVTNLVLHSAPKLLKAAGQGAGEFVYISGHDTPEWDLVDDFLGVLFSCRIYRIVWEMGGLQKFLEKKTPHLVILSPPAVSEEEREKTVWEIVRSTLPSTPVLWLVRDDLELPDFFPKDDKTVKFVGTFNFNPIPRLIKSISELTGIQSAIDAIIFKLGV